MKYHHIHLHLNKYGGHIYVGTQLLGKLYKVCQPQIMLEKQEKKNWRVAFKFSFPKLLR